MPTVISHAIAATAIGAVMVSGPSRARLWALGALCAMVPDLDVIPFRLGVPYHHMLGHRGLSHSLLFAAVLASAATALVLRKWPASASGPGLCAFFFVATASHGGARRDDHRRLRGGLFRAVLGRALLPALAPHRRFTDLGSKVFQSWRPGEDVERAWLGLATSDDGLRGRSRATSAG